MFVGEVEYISLDALVCKLKWLNGLMVSHGSVMQFICDRQSAFYLAHNPLFHDHNKHIEVELHFICVTIQDGTMVVSYVPTSSLLVVI